MSQRPGIRNFPVPSTLMAPAGTAIPRPTAAIAPPLVTTVVAASRVPLTTSTTVTFVMAIESSGRARTARGSVARSLAGAFPHAAPPRAARSATTATTLERPGSTMPFIVRDWRNGDWSKRTLVRLKPDTTDRAADPGPAEAGHYGSRTSHATRIGQPDHEARAGRRARLQRQPPAMSFRYPARNRQAETRASLAG